MGRNVNTMHGAGAILMYIVNPHSKHRVLQEFQNDFRYEASQGGFFDNEWIEKGFITDNSSVPDQLAWFIHPSTKQMLEASWMHDKIFRNQDYFLRKYWERLGGGNSQKNNLEKLRLEANREMKRKCIEQGLPKWKANLVFFAIHHTPVAKRIWKNKGIITDG